MLYIYYIELGYKALDKKEHTTLFLINQINVVFLFL